MSQPTIRIAIGADHGAIDIKTAVTAHLTAAGHDIEDYGTHTQEAVDYADYANLVAAAVADGTCDFGVLACTSGVGMCIAANRHRHARAAHARSVEEAITIRQHNDANILCLAGKYSTVATSIAMVDAFLATAFAGGRHTLRVCKASGSRIEETAGTADVTMWTSSSNLPLTVPRRFSGRIMPTCSRTPGHRPTPQFTFRCCNPEIKF